ncbi:MAG: PilC/PilY family type IV pilus protein [Pseudomonadota bacterium]
MNNKTLSILMLLGSLVAPAQALTFSQTPLFLASTEPRVMLLLSRDHELSRKAYTDYTDLDLDGTLDTTYNDSVNYYGYFNSKRCYVYDTGDERFEPSGLASGTNLHECSGEWSGNFLNWASMTRLDVVRKVLYGGFRSTDSTGTALGATVLERAFLPPDVHAFAKVYAPAGGATDVAKYTPYSSTAAITLCNVSDMGDGVQAGNISTVSGSNTSPAPLIKVASGSWPTWAMTEILQCKWDEQTVEPSPRPSSATHRLTGSSDLVARVAVCAPGKLEDKCKSYYTRATTPVETVKPVGLLQEYGDVDADRRVRFGLMTGSYKKNTSGGVLRKNISLLANNSSTALTSSSICGDNHTADEIDVCTGQFINQATGDTGIIDSLNRMHIAGYKTPASGAITATAVCSSGYNGSSPFACSASNLLSGTNGTCVDWGNPLSEMYHEALRYFAGKTAATSAYDVDDSASTAVIAGLGKDSWTSSSDPLPSTEWCALSNIIVLSTGLTSLDNATITSDITGLDPTALTDAVGVAEGLSGSYLIGSNGVTSNNLCSAKTLSNLSSASGICPELPHMKGGYLISGLASANRALDLRPTYATDRAKRWTGINADWVARQPLGTYTVGLAENLPSFEITVGTGKINIVPSCRSNGSTICSMTDLRVESYGATSGSFLVSWEDNSADSDYDMDTISRIEYCVGAACSPAVNADQINIKVSAAQSATGSGMELGYTVTGSSQDGTYFPIKIPGTATCNPTDCPVGGNANRNFFSHLTSPPAYRCTDFNSAAPAANYTCPDGTRMPANIVSATGCPANQSGGTGSNCGCAKTWTYTQSTTPAGLLKNPLWYAAKYGAPASSWDLENNNTGVSTPDGEPDHYFEVRNPANLFTSLSEVFDEASQPDASASSVATNTTTLQTKTRIFQAKFSSADWSGQLLSYPLDSLTGALGTQDWDAGVKINSQNYSTGRVILTKGSADGVPFLYANLTSTAQAELNENYLGTVDNCGAERVNYLRGDASNEGATGSFVSGSCSAAKFRPRNTSKLGDIVNSNPWFVEAPAAGYSDVDHPGYSAFRAAKISRDPVVYVAANDGMLHGFNSEVVLSSGVYVAGTDAGKEVLAYVPSKVYENNLSWLTDRTYNKNHRYYMDGSPMVGDADLSATATPDWRSVLVGGVGPGGKGYYALDVSDPGSFSQSAGDAAATVLWEFTETDDTDVGYAFNHPPAHLSTNYPKQIVKMKLAGGNRWAVILGNGYNSAAGKAALYILFIKDGTDGAWTPWASGTGGDYVKIVADSSGSNGLSTPVPYDMDGDGFVDVVYAGDLKGRMWKFLVGDTNPANWQVDFSTATCGASSSCTPLFTATDGSSNPQPIIWPAEVSTHPGGVGTMVMFGTGKYLESADNASAGVQTAYGVWDNNDALIGTTGSATGTRASGLDELEVVTSTAVVSSVTYNTRTVQKKSSGTSGTLGWYLDLPTSKERVTGIPKLLNGVLYFNTFIPSTGACESGGTGWLMAVNYKTGQAPSHNVFTAIATPVAGVQFGAALGGTTLIRSAGGSKMFAAMSLTSGNIATTGTSGNLPELNSGPGGFGRVDWRELVQ